MKPLAKQRCKGGCAPKARPGLRRARALILAPPSRLQLMNVRPLATRGMADTLLKVTPPCAQPFSSFSLRSYLLSPRFRISTVGWLLAGTALHPTAGRSLGCAFMSPTKRLGSMARESAVNGLPSERLIGSHSSFQQARLLASLVRCLSDFLL